MNVADDRNFDGTRGIFPGYRPGIKPDNGLFYSPIELEAIWALEIELADIFKGREHAFRFHEYWRVRPLVEDHAFDHVGSIDDGAAADLLLRDSLAQQDDPLPEYLHPDCSLDCELPHLPMPWESGEK